MKPDLHALHIAAGLRAGRDRTCGKKAAYASEESAAGVAATMNKKPDARNVQEAYPCAFCKKWHVGLKMSKDDLHATAYTPMSTNELASIPASLLLRDIIAHGCDDDGDGLCDRCHGKWEEIDRRLPPRTVKP